MPVADKGGQDNSGLVSRIAGEAIVAYRALRLESDGRVKLAALKGDTVFGISQTDAAVGEPVLIKLIGSPGTFRITVNSAVILVAGGTKLWLADAAGGKFTPTNPTAGRVWFMAIADAAGDNSIIEAVHHWNQPAS